LLGNANFFLYQLYFLSLQQLNLVFIAFNVAIQFTYQRPCFFELSFRCFIFESSDSILAFFISNSRSFAVIVLSFIELEVLIMS